MPDRLAASDGTLERSIASWIFAQERRNASAITDNWSFKTKSAGDFRARRVARGVAPTLREPICCSTCALVRKVLSRSSRNTENRLPRVSPTKPPTKANIGAFDDVPAADGLAREATVALGMINAGLAAVSSALFSKSRSTA